MRLLISLAISSFLLIALVGCHSTDSANRAVSISTPAPSAKSTVPPAPGVHADGVRRITTVELQALITKGQAFVVDVRNEAAYNAGHISGARLIPNTEIGQHIKELPRDKTIVTYCS